MVKSFYRLEIREVKGVKTEPWHGRATLAKLNDFVQNYLRSFEFGGENYYIVRARGYRPVLMSARIVAVRSGKIMAEIQGYSTVKRSS